MKAAFMTKFGGPEVFSVGEMATPAIRPGHVLLRVDACGLNYYDTLVRSGAVSQDIPLPHVPGSDVVGTIESIGEGVKDFKPGDSVIVLPGFSLAQHEMYREEENFAPDFFPGGTFNHGGYGQFMLVEERLLIKNDIPMAAEELASMPLVLVTAVHTVKTLGEVGPTSRVLVHAGASGSGSMAIQMAKALGASVITTVSNDHKATLARKLGADEVINYKKENFADSAREWTNGDGVDVVIDPLGGDALHDNIRSLRWGGKIINYGLVSGMASTIPNVYEFFRGQFQLLGAFMGTREELLLGLDLVRSDKIKPVVDEVLPLDAVRDAHTRIDNHQVAGNLVLLPWA